MAKTKSVTIKTTKIVDGVLYSKGGEYEVDANVAGRLKAAGALDKVPVKVEPEAEQPNADDSTN